MSRYIIHLKMDKNVMYLNVYLKKSISILKKYISAMLKYCKMYTDKHLFIQYWGNSWPLAVFCLSFISTICQISLKFSEQHYSLTITPCCLMITISMLQLLSATLIFKYLVPSCRISLHYKI